MNGFVAPDEEVAPEPTGGFIAPDEETTQWSDLPGNIIPDAKSVVKGIGESMKGPALDIMSGDVASALPKLAKMNPVEQVDGIVAPIENLGSKEGWIKNPVSNTMTAASIAVPAIEGAAGMIDAPQPTGDPNLLQRMGAGARNNATGISPDTIERLGKGANPVKTGVALANSLEKEGATGLSKMETWDNVKRIHDEAGKATRNARDAIKAESDKYAGVEDPTVVSATPILETLLNTTKQLKESARSGVKQLGRFWNETYNSLSQKASNNGGVLTLEDIHSEMQDVGKDMKGNPGTARYNAAKDIYHHLIDVQEQMVSEIADNAKNPDLKNNLLGANKQYTKYSKILSDVTNQGERGATGGDSMLSGQRPLRATIRASQPLLGKILLSLGNKAAKYGPILEEAAKKGTQNLMMTDYLLKQRDPDYAESSK